ncbi:MAG: S9 family peptidase [Deltaproteobacteria bacterium]|nr:S9 family peptidase [Deltaproteobacteria bacterium]
MATSSLPVLATACGSTPIAAPPTPPSEPDAPVPSLPLPPDTARDPVTDTLHGVEITDPYRWLEDVKDPRVSTWVDQQDAHTRTLLELVGGRDRLAKRFTELFYQDSMSPPLRRGARAFFTRRHKDREKSIVYYREGADPTERVLLDPNTWTVDGSTALGNWNPSWDGRYVAYNVKENNADEAVMKVFDVGAGKDTGDVIPGTKYAGAAWTADAKGFYYVHLPEVPADEVDTRPGKAQIRYHALGADPARDPLVFPATGSSESFIGVDVSRDGKWIFVTVQYGWNAVDIYYKRLGAGPALALPTALDLMTGAGEDVKLRIAKTAKALGYTPLFVGKDALASVVAWQGSFYVLTNDGAPRYRIYKVDPKRPTRAAWKEIVPEGESTIEAFEIAGGHLVVSRLVSAASRMELRTLDGKPVRDIALPGIGSVVGVVGNPDDDELYYAFTSFTTPPEVYLTSIAKGDTKLWFEVELPVDTSGMEVEQVFYPSKDGTPISMFIIHKKGLVKDGSHPTLLYGYGGFNQNMTPGFGSSIVVWLEMGGVYAMPNLRGGGEYGEAWHRAGMLDKKQNVFDDFIAAGEYLVAQGYTKPERLAIRGGSNGGLLVGAAMVQRPDLVRPLNCAVPQHDMVRYHLFGSGRTWIPEYGSAEDPALFPAILAYSPYHHVKLGTRYPAMLMVGADSDDRVDPMHARKFTALVQWAVRSVPDAHPIMFRVERQAGHGGGDKVQKTVETYTDQWAFLAWQLDMRIP